MSDTISEQIQQAPHPAAENITPTIPTPLEGHADHTGDLADAQKAKEEIKVLTNSEDTRKVTLPEKNEPQIEGSTNDPLDTSRGIAHFEKYRQEKGLAELGEKLKKVA